MVCNEIIVEGQNGTIIPVKDSETLYLAMNKVVEVLNLGPTPTKFPYCFPL
jgi:hypothetical protein